MEVAADFWCKSLSGRGPERVEKRNRAPGHHQRQNEGDESCLICLLSAVTWQRRQDRGRERWPGLGVNTSGEGRAAELREGGKAEVGARGSSRCFSIVSL